MIPAQAVEAAARVLYAKTRTLNESDIRAALLAAAPHMLADILEDAASTAETDELRTAAEVIYDLRRHAKDLRPTT